MPIQTVEYSSFNKICCGTLPAEIIICVPPELTESGLNTIDAVLFAERCVGSGCRNTYIYTIQIDDALLAPNVTLSGAEITGIICRDCLTDYIDNNSGGTPSAGSCYSELFGFGQDGDLDVLAEEDVLLQLPGSDIGREYYFQDVTIAEGGILRSYAKVWQSAAFGKQPNGCYMPLRVNGTLTINGTISAEDPAAPVQAGPGPGDPASGFDAFGLGVQGGGQYLSSYDLGGLPTVTFVEDGPGGGNGPGGIGGSGGYEDEGQVFAQEGTPSFNRGKLSVSSAVYANLEDVCPWAIGSGSGFAGGGRGGNGGAGGFGGSVGGADGGENLVSQNHFPWVPGKVLPGGLVDFQVGYGYCGEEFAQGFWNSIWGQKVIGGGSGGAGGGGGGYNGTGIGGEGGAGGGGGGTIAIYARNVVIGPNGLLRAIAGDGCQGADGQGAGGPNTGDGGGGGGGGGGGLIYIVCQTITFTGNFEDYIAIEGGDGGLGGEGTGGGTHNGVEGEAGVDGKCYVINLTNCTITSYPAESP